MTGGSTIHCVRITSRRLLHRSSRCSRSSRCGRTKRCGHVLFYWGGLRPRTVRYPAPAVHIMASTRLVSIKTTTTMVVSLVMKPDVPETPKKGLARPASKSRPDFRPAPRLQENDEHKGDRDEYMYDAYPCYHLYLPSTASIIPIKLSDFKDAPPIRAPSISFMRSVGRYCPA